MSICVIGHGTSLVGKGLGPEIDKHTVVRLKDPSWQVDKDYGKRMDYCCASTETMQQMLHDRRVPKQYWAQPKKGEYNKRLEEHFNRTAKAPLVIPLQLFNEWNERYKEHGMSCRNFSVGTAAIIYSLDLLGEKVVKLGGFDNLLDPAKLEYWKAQRGKWVSHHDWYTEHKMLQVVAEHYRAEITPL